MGFLIKIRVKTEHAKILSEQLATAIHTLQKSSGEDPDKSPGDGHSATELCLALMLVMQRVSRVQSAKKRGGSALLNGREDTASVQTLVI